MPLIATIGNVRIRIYFVDTGRHNRPHFHAASPEAEAVIALPALEIIAGALPLASRRMVLHWASENLPLLIEAWNVANPGAPTYML